jgi:multisubunit Na+/H+ antiporter MnhG subunit
MVKEIKGPWGIILIGPAAHNTPYKAWDRNQGTYLAIALAIPLFLTLFATIGIPIIPGAYTVKVVAADQVGQITYGVWGMCLAGKGIDGVVV